MPGRIKEFRQFLLRGSVVDLAVGVVIGAAFGAVVTSLVKDIITPIVAMIFGKADFSNLTFTINDAVFRYGAFITAVVSFLLIATAVFWLVVLPINRLMDALRTEPPVDVHTRTCPECLSEVPMEARRCAFCTSELTPQPAG
jgi:large conductance mechanosensitive channel